MNKVIALACDGEFTSFDKLGGDLIKWGFVEILDNYTLGRKQAWSLKPVSTKYFTESSQAIHKISYWQASNFPERKSSLISMLNWLTPLRDEFQLELIFHGNANLDYAWLMNTFLKEDMQSSFYTAFNSEKTVNTIKLCKKYLTHIKESEVINPVTEKLYTKYSLRNCADHYGIELDHHEVLSDTVACGQIYCNIMKGVDIYTGVLI